MGFAKGSTHPTCPLILPDRQITDLPVQPCLQKYFPSRLTQITSISLAVSSLWRGVSRSSRTRGGMRWTRERQARKAIAGRDEPRERFAACKTIGALADGKAVWSWHPLLVLNSRRLSRPDRVRQNLNPRMTVTRRIRRRG